MSIFSFFFSYDAIGTSIEKHEFELKQLTQCLNNTGINATSISNALECEIERFVQIKTNEINFFINKTKNLTL